MNELSNAIQRFDFINKSKSQLADWRIIRAAASEALKPSHKNARDVICSSTICCYCNGFDTECDRKEDYSCFDGRKLSPIA